MRKWVVSVGSVVKTGQPVYFPALLDERGKTIKLGAVCYTHIKAQDKVKYLNAQL